MTKTRSLLLFIATAFSAVAFAARTPGFSMSAFNAAVPSSEKNAVFSPYAFEIDCVLMSEAFDRVGKARYVDALGAIVGYENVYRPILDSYASARTNGCGLVSARAFLVPSTDALTKRYRTLALDEYGVQTCSMKRSSEGAECYLRAAMEGEMEKLRFPSKVTSANGTYFLDLEALRISSPTGAPAAALWRGPGFTMLRLAVADGFRLYAVLPGKDVGLASIRGGFAAAGFDSAVVKPDSVTEDGVYRGPVDVELPAVSVLSAVDLAPAFRAAGLPLTGFEEMAGNLADIRQCTRFTFGGYRGRTAGAETAAEVPRFRCDRPFLYFVYHEPTRTVPVAGVYVGGTK